MLSLSLILENPFPCGAAAIHWHGCAAWILCRALWQGMGLLKLGICEVNCFLLQICHVLSLKKICHVPWQLIHINRIYDVLKLGTCQLL